MDTNNFIVHTKLENAYERLAGDVEKRFGTINCKVKIHLPIGKNKTLIELIKDELGGKIMKKIAALRPNMYSHLTDDNVLAKKIPKSSNKCMIKWETEFQHYKECQKNKKQYCNPKKVPEVRHTMYSLKWSTTLH